MPDRSHLLTRRSVLAGVAVLAVTATHRFVTARAQDATPTPAAVATPSAGSGGIQPTGVGDVPSTGARRPGPANAALEFIRTDTVAPVGLAIEAAGIDAGIETLRVIDGAMQDPSRTLGRRLVREPWLPRHGRQCRHGGTHRLLECRSRCLLQPLDAGAGDEIVVTGDNGKAYPFAVEWVRQYDSESIPLDEVAGPTEDQSLTLITCGGAFDYANGHYLQRTVVRANRAGAELAAAA